MFRRVMAVANKDPGRCRFLAEHRIDSNHPILNSQEAFSNCGDYSIHLGIRRGVEWKGATSQLAIRLSLQIEQVGVVATQGYQFLVRAVFYDLAVLQDKNAVGQAYSAEAMADENGSLTFG